MRPISVDQAVEHLNNDVDRLRERGQRHFDSSFNHLFKPNVADLFDFAAPGLGKRKVVQMSSRTCV